MNFPTSSTPATQTSKDKELVTQENEYLRSIDMPEYSMKNEQDIAEAARDIRERNEIFLKQNTTSYANFKG